MRLKTFFEKFEQFADAPNAVAKIRELVLELAVQGKLVPQELNDEPAEALLRRIDSEREQLVKNKEIRRQESLGPITNEAPFSIPGSWQWRRLADVCFVITDGAHHTPHYLETGVPFLSVKDVSRGEIDFSNTRLISKEAHRELCKRCRPELGDILLTKVGTTGIAVTVEDSREFSIFVSLALLKFSHKNLERRYLKHLINSPFVRKQSAENTQGIGNKNLVLRLINQFSVPLPPLAEQKRIVAKVDELMALCDRLETQQQERDTRHAALARAALARFADTPTLANLNLLFYPSYAIGPADIRNAILSLAVRGKLVPQDANDEPVSGLRQRICAMDVGTTRRSKSMFPPTTEIEDDEEPFELPEKWEWLRLGELLPEFQNGVSSRGDKGGKPVIVIRLADINNRRISLEQPREIPIASKDIAKYSLRNGDVLITRVNGSADIVGSFIPVETDFDAIYCDHFIRMRIDSKLMYPSYISLIGETPLVRNQISSLFITTAGQKTVNQGHIGSLLIAIPPLAEQRRIVAKVDQLMTLVDRLEAQLTASRAAAVNLMDAVVAELTMQ